MRRKVLRSFLKCTSERMQVAEWNFILSNGNVHRANARYELTIPEAPAVSDPHLLPAAAGAQVRVVRQKEHERTAEDTFRDEN